MHLTSRFLARASLAVLAVAAPTFADADQLLVFEDYGSQDRVSRFSWPEAELVNHAVGIGVSDLRTPGGMTIGPDGLLYVASFDTDTVLRYDVETGQRIGNGIFIDTAVGGLDGPAGLAFDVDGSLLVSSFHTDLILRYAADGTPLGPVNTAGSALDGPADLLLAADGTCFVSSRGNNRVIRINADGTLWADDGTFFPGVNNPHGLAIGPDGHLYAASFNNDRIVRIDVDTAEQVGSFITGGGMNGPVGIAFDGTPGEEDKLYVASRLSNSVLLFNGPLGFLLDTPIEEDLTRPHQIVFVRTGACPTDLTGDGSIGFEDLVEVLANWGPCPE